MGDIIDERGATMPVPGNGRAKRSRIDREGNMVVAGDLYYYTAFNNRVSMEGLLTGLGELDDSSTAIDITKPINMVSTVAPKSLPLAQGSYHGQRLTIVNVGGFAVTITSADLVGGITSIVLQTGESVSLLWVKSTVTGPAAGFVFWCVTGTSTANSLVPAYA